MWLNKQKEPSHMKYQKFAEYLDANSKLRATAPVKKIADFEGKVDTKPVKEKKHKDAGGKGQDGEIKPYKGGPDARDPNKGKLADGFADKGDKKLKYTLTNDVGKAIEGVPGGKGAPTWPKTKTQEWVDRTKNMSLAEFTKTVRDEALEGCEKEVPHNSIKETVSACKCNKKHVAALVREMKRNGLFGKLVSEMVQHPETFKALAILMERDESYARKFVKAMNEMIAPPIDGAGGPPMMGKKKKPPMMGDMGMPHPDDMGDDDSDEDGDDMDGDDDMGDDMDGDDDMGDDDMGDGSDMDGDEGMDDDGGLGDDDLGIGGDPAADAGMAPHDKMAPPSFKKKPKLHAHHHLLNAMKDHPSMMGGGM